MQLRKGYFIKHKRYLDICLEITNCFDYGHGYDLKVNIWNMGFVNSYHTGQKMRLNIAKLPQDIKETAERNTSCDEWQVLRGPSLMDQCYRNSKWMEING